MHSIRKAFLVESKDLCKHAQTHALTHMCKHTHAHVHVRICANTQSQKHNTHTRAQNAQHARRLVAGQYSRGMPQVEATKRVVEEAYSRMMHEKYQRPIVSHPPPAAAAAANPATAGRVAYPPAPPQAPSSSTTSAPSGFARWPPPASQVRHNITCI